MNIHEESTSTILVVDDDGAICEALEELLTSEGYSVQIARNGSEALQEMRSSPPPDVVLLDLMMPVMSGWEVLVVATEEPALRSIPIVVMSAMTAALADPFRRGGVRACLTKPLDINLLLGTLKAVVESTGRAVSEQLSEIESGIK